MSYRVIVTRLESGTETWQATATDERSARAAFEQVLSRYAQCDWRVVRLTNGSALLFLYADGVRVRTHRARIQQVVTK